MLSFEGVEGIGALGFCERIEYDFGYHEVVSFNNDS